jgi:polar amino acid transport system permease protein
MNEFILFIQRIFPELLQGTKVTIQLSLGSLLLGFVIGLFAALLRVYGNIWLQRVVKGYVNILRGTPLMVQLFLIYYGLPDFGITFSRMTAAYITLGLNSSAYQAEYFRGAIQSVAHGQMLAARAIGMSRLRAIRFIILPQALRLALPAWSNEMIAIVKYTAVVFLIAVPDLMGKAKIISSRHFDPIATYVAVAFIYLVLVGTATLILRIIRKKLNFPEAALDGLRR